MRHDKPEYMAVLLSADGECVTDYRHSESIEEVQECLADMGSRWYFYPLHVIVRDYPTNIYRTSHRRILSIDYDGDDLDFLIGKSVGGLSMMMRMMYPLFLRLMVP